MLYLLILDVELSIFFFDIFYLCIYLLHLFVPNAVAVHQLLVLSFKFLIEAQLDCQFFLLLLGVISNPTKSLAKLVLLAVNAQTCVP